jgi:glucose-6-phosphate isomerase
MSHNVAAAFLALETHARTLDATRTLDLFAQDPSRFQDFSVALDDDFLSTSPSTS